MRINQDNYEQFFLDHAEGNLSPEMEKELAAFLEANPDLKLVLDDFDPSPLQTVEIRNELLKTGLKKHLYPTDHIGEDKADEWLIRNIEGLLNEAEKKELEEFLTLNPAFDYDNKLFGLTRLVPDLSISYGRKNELKKKAILLPATRFLWLIPAAAAAILLFIGIRYFQAPDINPKPAVHQPVAEIPGARPIQTPFKVSIPEMKKEIKAIKHVTEDQAVEIAHANSFRLKPVETQSGIIDEPSADEIAMIIPGRNNLPVSTAGKKEPSLIARVFDNMLKRAVDGISNRPKLDRISKPDFNFWSIAEAGITGFNSISDRELELYVRKDEDGKVKSYALVEQERLILAKELNKE